jgi:glucosamine kinase
MKSVVVGVDGGGSRTRARVADEQGQEIGHAEGPASAVRPGASDGSADVIAAVVREALSAAGHADVRPRVLCVGVAGVGRETERVALTQALEARALADQTVVLADFQIALDDAFGSGPGVLLIAGTGSVAFGRSPTGEIARCGGWGPVIGDEGSAAWLGRRALSVVTSASDGREPDTALTGAMLTATDVPDVASLIPWAADASASKLATLAPVVFTVADTGDLRANALVTLACEELMLHIRSLSRRVFVDERAAVPVARAGGLLSRGSMLRRRLEHRLKSGVPGAQVKPDDVIPARGAVRSALRFLAAAKA